MSNWNDSEPIYRQLRDALVREIIRGTYQPGEVVPSVRQVASDERINPLTVSRAYQMLVDEGLLEKRRGLGMYVTEGGQALALDQERARFLSQEWPVLRARLNMLGLSVADLEAHGPSESEPQEDPS